MAHYLTIHSIRWGATVDQISWLSSNIIAGFGMFGLAANGMCLTALAQSPSRVPTQVLADSEETEEMSAAKRLRVFRDGSQVNLGESPRCQC